MMLTVVVHGSNPSNQKAEAGGSQWVPGLPGPHSEPTTARATCKTMSWAKKKQNKANKTKGELGHK